MATTDERIEELEEKVENLEKRIERLEALLDNYENVESTVWKLLEANSKLW